MTKTLTLRQGHLEATIDPQTGARLAALSHRGKDIILPAGRVEGYYGDTFWPSPQERFNWPPPATLDAKPYQIRHYSKSSATLSSARDEAYGFQLDKRFELSENAIHFTYQLTNIWNRPQNVAPWQVTRAPRKGELIWATGHPFRDEDRLLKQREDPGCYYLHERNEKPFPAPIEKLGAFSHLSIRDVPSTCKLFADAQGWLAHLQNNYLIIRRFPDLHPSQAAPRHGEIELYFNPQLDYIELENQGAYQTLQPGKALSYQTVWHIVQVKEELLSPCASKTRDNLHHLLPANQVKNTNYS